MKINIHEFLYLKIDTFYMQYSHKAFDRLDSEHIHVHVVIQSHFLSTVRRITLPCCIFIYKLLLPKAFKIVPTRIQQQHTVEFQNILINITTYYHWCLA